MNDDGLLLEKSCNLYLFGHFDGLLLQNSCNVFLYGHFDPPPPFGRIRVKARS